MFRKYLPSASCAFIPVIAYFLKGSKTPELLAITATLLFFLFSTQIPQLCNESLPRTVLIPFSLFLVGSLISIFALPPLDAFLMSFSKIIFYTAFSLIFLPHKKSFTAYFFAGVCAISILEALLVTFHFPPTDSIGGILDHSLHSGLLLSIGVACLLSLLVKKEIPKFWKILSFCCLILFFYIIFRIRCRSAIVSIFVIVGLYCPKKWRNIYFLISFCAIIGIVIGLTKNHPFTGYLKLEGLNLLNSLGRLSIWKTALRSISNHPFIGVGLGNFESAYLRYQYPSFGPMQYVKTTMFAHNGFLQVASEAGLPTLISLICGFGSIFYLTIRSGNEHWLTKWAIAIVSIFGITSINNYSLFLPSNGLIFAGALGILIRQIKTDATVSLRPFIFPFLSVLTVIVLFISFLGLSEFHSNRQKYQFATKLFPVRSENYYQIGIQTLGACGNETTNRNLCINNGLRQINKAIRWNFHYPFYYSRLAKILTIRSQSSDEDILKNFALAIANAPQHAPFYIQKAFFELKTNKLDDATIDFSTSVRLEPMTPLPLYGLGLVKLAQGRNEDACHYFQEAKKLKNHHNTKTYESDSAYGQFMFAVNTSHLDELISKVSPKKPANGF